MEERERCARAFIQRVQRVDSWLFSPEGNKQFYHAGMEVEDIDVLVDLARVGEKKALKIVRTRMRHLHKEAYKKALREGRTVLMVPTSVRELALEVFIYGEPHAKSGPKPTTNGLRNTTIALLVKWVNEGFGYPVYTRVEHRGNPDAPMTAFRLVGDEVGLDERTVEDIYSGCKKMLDRSARGPR